METARVEGRTLRGRFTQTLRVAQGLFTDA